MYDKKRILVAVLAVFTVFMLASASQKETQAQEPMVVPDTVSSGGEGNQKGREILTLLADLKKITLDESVFSDPVFRSLKDISVELIPEPKGRPNPFAPLGKDAILNEAQGMATFSPRDISFSSTGASDLEQSPTSNNKSTTEDGAQ